MKHHLLATLSALALAACAAGPGFEHPQTSASAAAPFIGTSATGVTAGAVNETWWRLYDDPVLDSLVSDALAANTDLRVAMARVERARAALRGATSDRLPSTTLGAAGNYGEQSRVTMPKGDREGSTFNIGLNVAYEVDLFGRVSRSIEAARGDVAAADWDANAVRLVVVADTTRAYVDAASAAERLGVAQEVVALLDRSVELTAKRVEAGRAEQLDLIRIKALREQRSAVIPALTAERESALFRLATLTGRTPQELPPAAKTRISTPLVEQAIPVGDGAGLLARRPDVRAAEQRLAAATARIGVATSDLYPHVSLGGSVASLSTNTAGIFTGGALTWLLGSLISWSFPNQEAARARIDASKADTRAELARFDGTVLRALEETERALSTYGQALERRGALLEARNDAERAARITRARQREGRIDFLAVLDAERTLADAESGLADADSRIATAQVDLFRALGGGWQKL